MAEENEKPSKTKRPSDPPTPDPQLKGMIRKSLEDEE